MVTASPSALDFLVHKLLDREDGGVHRTVDVGGDRLLRRSKHLSDQASAVRVLARHGSEADLEPALEGLLKMQDQQGSPGFVELVDLSWRPLPSRQVRTLCHQLDAASALLVAAVRLGRDDLRVAGVDLINRCLSTASGGSLPVRQASNWTSVLVHGPSVNTATAAVGALSVAYQVERSSVDTTMLRLFADPLASQAGRADGHDEPSGISHCGLIARSALALSRAARALDLTGYAEAACRLLDLAMDRYHDPVDGGFWDRPVPDVDGPSGMAPSVASGQPPRPIKRTCDAALLLSAALELRESDPGTAAVAEHARAALAAVTDHHAGGVFLGIGYDWESATEPTVRSFRQSWLRSDHDELPVGDDLEHLDLRQKTAFTHARAAAAQSFDDAVARGFAEPDALVLNTDVGEPYDRIASTRRATSVRPCSPAGLPERDVTAIYHVVGALHASDEAGLARAEVLEHLVPAQNDDGGFGESRGMIGNVTSTHHAVLAMSMVGAEPRRPGACVDFLLGCENPDGTFGDVPGMAGDIYHTGLAVAALRALGAEPVDAVRTATMVRRALHPDGGCGDRAGQGLTTPALRWALATLHLLGRPVPRREASVSWLRRCRRPEGGFGPRPGGTATITSTCHAVAALALLGSEPDTPDACRAWLAGRSGGGEDPVSYVSTTSSIQEAFAFSQARYALQGKARIPWLAMTG